MQEIKNLTQAKLFILCSKQLKDNKKSLINFKGFIEILFDVSKLYQSKEYKENKIHVQGNFKLFIDKYLKPFYKIL